MGEAKTREAYEEWQKADRRVYFSDSEDPQGDLHVYEKYRRLEAAYVVLMRAYVRSGVQLPILYEGKILDAEQRKGVESGLYEEVAKQLIASVEVWRGEAAAIPDPT